MTDAPEILAWQRTSLALLATAIAVIQSSPSTPTP
ncbi:DUF202 domain-containing protein [Nocardia salmonicida]